MLDPLEEEDASHEKDEPQTEQDRSGRLPSTSEIRAINEARHLYKSNTFKAQVSILCWIPVCLSQVHAFVVRSTTTHRSPTRVQVFIS